MITSNCISFKSELGKKLERACRKAFYTYDLAADPKIAIALSGGKDSLTLMLLLKAISGYGLPPFTLHAIHVSGQFSCGPSVNEEYLSQICSDLEIPLSIVHSPQNFVKQECYSCSRERRRLLFDEAKKQGFKAIAFGHHQDDSIQTLMMNLLQKGEFESNLPKVTMYDYGITIIRPLIFTLEREIIAFAKQQGFARITCQCPIGQFSKRIKIKELIDQMEELFPHTRTNLAQAARTYGTGKANLPPVKKTRLPLLD